MTASPVSPADPAEAARAHLAALLARAGEEDRAAFAELYSLTAAKLFGICVRICGQRQAAEDVLQEIYVTIWRRAGTYQRARGSPIAWLASIARNRAIDWHRAQHPAAPAGPVEDIADPQPDGETLLLLDEHERRLHGCLEGLEPNQRETIRAAFFGGFTYAELAERQGVPLGTAKSWVRRGLLRLRGCLDDT